MLLAVATGISSAALGGLGFVLQQQVAATQPPADVLRLRLLVHLARRPRWLAGVGAMVCGQVLGAVALGAGGLGLVEPLMATSLLFALAISAAWSRERLGRSEWAGALLLAGGLGGFVAAASPGSGDLRLDWPSWAAAVGAVVAVVGMLVLQSRRRPSTATARNIGLAAGVMFGLQDALTRRLLGLLPHGGVLAVVTGWPLYAVIAAGVCSLLLAQSAFEEATLPASLPPMTFAEPVTGIALGAGLFSERLAAAPGLLAAEAACLVAAACGVWLVGGSARLTRAAAAAGP